jgi:hypothetical protein
MKVSREKNVCDTIFSAHCISRAWWSWIITFNNLFTLADILCRIKISKIFLLQYKSANKNSIFSNFEFFNDINNWIFNDLQEKSASCPQMLNINAFSVFVTLFVLFRALLLSTQIINNITSNWPRFFMRREMWIWRKVDILRVYTHSVCVLLVRGRKQKRT